MEPATVEIYNMAKLSAIDLNKIIAEYGRIILSWPTVSLVCFLLFVCLFKKEIKELINRIKKIYGIEMEQKEQEDSLEPDDADTKIAKSLEQSGITLSTDQFQRLEAQFDQLNRTNSEQIKRIENKDQLIRYAFQRAEIYEFAYLEKILVLNTKLALLWFYVQPATSSTQENFMLTYKLPSQIINQQGEKAAIINALIVYELIENHSNPALFKVTQKGERFLKALKLIQNG